MTAAGDGRDPELQAAVDRAVAALATRLRPWGAMKDPDAFARAYVEDMYGGHDHWRPWPRSDRIPSPGEGDPAAHKRGVDTVRKAFRDAIDHKETDHG